MHTSLLIARLVLAGVFAVASLSKLADLHGSRAAVAGFGVPERVAGPLGTLLPFAELATAIALLPASWARYGVIGACILLTAFAGAIARSMIRGEAPDCHCFGALHSEPVGARALARDLLLLGVAGFVLAGGWSNAGPSATAWVGRLSDSDAVAVGAGLAILALAAVTVGGFLALVRQNGRLLLRIDELEARLDEGGVAAVSVPAEAHHGLPLGSPAPDFGLSGLYGETATLESLTSAERPVLLLFTDPTCGPCNALLPQIAAWQHDHAAALTLAVISRGSVDDNRAKIREHGVGGVWLDRDLAVYNAYQAIGTPGGVLIDAQGQIASPVVAGADAIAGLVNRAVTPHVPIVQVPAGVQSPSALSVGAEAPSVDLPDLTGARIGLAVTDRDTLVLFWNPACGFCQQMLDELRRWEESELQGTPRLLLISTGSVEDNKAMGLRAPILLDQSFSAGTAFGTTGTPSAILVDHDGKIASELALGAAAILQLGATVPFSSFR
jgi:peroxiredoxin